jgi:hypothetical protein
MGRRRWSPGAVVAQLDSRMVLVDVRSALAFSTNDGASLHQILLPSPLDLELFHMFSFADLFEGFRSIFVSFVHGVFPSDPDPCYLFFEICAGSAFLIQVGFLLKFQAYV